MTRGRVGDKTYTGHNGAATDALRALDKLAKTPEGQYGRTSAPWQEQLLSCIQSGVCPWCGRGPWKVLATHTRSAHGVTGQQLREQAGLTKYASICDPQHSAARAEMRRGERLPDVAYDRTRHKKRTFSAAGLDAQRAKLAAVRDPEQSRAASQERARRKLAANQAKYVEAERLYREGMLLADIGKAVGLHPRYVRNALVRAGIEVGDGRAARSRNREFRERQEERRKKALASQARKREERTRERIARFEELGATWAAAHACADEWSVSVRTAVDFLRKRGVSVPDGRSA